MQEDIILSMCQNKLSLSLLNTSTIAFVSYSTYQFIIYNPDPTRPIFQKGILYDSHKWSPKQVGWHIRKADC